MKGSAETGAAPPTSRRACATDGARLIRRDQPDVRAAVALAVTAKAAASTATIDAGATIPPPRGPTDHQPWLQDENAEVGVDVLRAVKARLDPADVLELGALMP